MLAFAGIISFAGTLFSFSYVSRVAAEMHSGSICTSTGCHFFFTVKKRNEHESASHRENFKGRSQDSDMELPGIGEQSDRAELMTWLRMDFLELAARPR